MGHTLPPSSYRFTLRIIQPAATPIQYAHTAIISISIVSIILYSLLSPYIYKHSYDNDLNQQYAITSRMQNMIIFSIIRIHSYGSSQHVPISVYWVSSTIDTCIRVVSGCLLLAACLCADMPSSP